MATDDGIREAVRAALAAAAFRVNPVREDHIRTLARHCEDLLAAVAAERERCATVMEGVFRDGGFPGPGRWPTLSGRTRPVDGWRCAGRAGETAA